MYMHFFLFKTQQRTNHVDVETMNWITEEFLYNKGNAIVSMAILQTKLCHSV
jgi:hypothetical protein